MPYNLTDPVTPSQWKPGSFQPFEKLSFDDEFELVAALHLFYHADLDYETRANAARRRLRRLGHPLATMGADEADGSRRRYNALVMAIAEQEVPGIEAYVDARGAFAFRGPGDRDVLVGDSSGTFAFHASANRVRECLHRVAEPA
jgi:hypothetical protein